MSNSARIIFLAILSNAAKDSKTLILYLSTFFISFATYMKAILTFPYIL